MDEVKNISIALVDVPESERIIFKLICSVSARTRGRSKHYVLCTDDFRSKANILIRNMMASRTAVDKNSQAYQIELSDPVSADTNVTGTLSRPLIATRVLTALDDFVDTYFNDAYVKQEEESASAAAESVYTDFGFTDDDKIEDEDDIDTVSLELTEEEACELAIVHDETLTNPANRENDYLKDIQPAEVTPISSARSDALEQGRELFSWDSGSETQVEVKQEGEKPRALVVDDSPSVRKQLEIELELFNVNVDYAATAKEAMDLLDTDDYDVAFLDVVLPDKDGFSICRHIKETSKDTTVIMLTGKAKQADKVKGALAGCNAYMVKPVGRMTFQSTVRNYLSLAESASAIEAGF